MRQAAALFIGIMSFGLWTLAALADVMVLPKVGLVTELPMIEVYNGHLVHDGRLWVTRSRASDTDPHRLEVYDPKTLQLLQTINLKHTGAFVQPYGPNSVVVVGKTATPYWQTHYTVVSRSGASYGSRVTTFSEQYMVDHMTSDGQALFFGDPGSRSIFKLSGPNTLHALGGQISGPGPMAAKGPELWVIERRSFELGDENIVRVNVSTGSAQRVFTDRYRNGLTAIALLQDSPWVAASETLADQVLLVNRVSNVLEHQIPVNGNPRGLTQLGGCLVVASVEPKMATFISLWGEAPKILAQWDLAAAGDRLKMPQYIAADAASGRVFLRSSYYCTGCSVTQSSVYFAEEASGDTFKQCLSHSLTDSLTDSQWQ